DDVLELLGVAALHVGAEGAEGLLAGAARPLIDVMDDILGQARQHALAVAGIEGPVVALDKCNGVGGHGCSSGSSLGPTGLRCLLSRRKPAVPGMWGRSLTRQRQSGAPGSAALRRAGLSRRGGATR